MRNLSNEFKNKKLNYDKMINYGFKKINDTYLYEEEIENFKLVINIKDKNNAYSKLIEIETMEEFLPVDMENISGEFISNIKQMYISKINGILSNCTDIDFNSSQTNRVVKYIKDKYNDDLIFLWEKYPDCGVFRHENNKWYGLIMNISKSKLGFNDKSIVDIIDLKIDPKKIDTLVDNNKYFRGYHMNKKHWMTIVLDDSLKDEEIFNYIDESYNAK